MKLGILAVLVFATVANATRGPGEWLQRLRNNRVNAAGQPISIDQTQTEAPFIGQVGQGIFPVRGKSGYVGVTDDPVKNQIFYWFFESQSDSKKDPILIWLTGGPGCSSEFGLAFEVGPWLVLKDPDTGAISVSSNQFTWNAKANLLFIDQPIGVGYSLGDPSKYPTNQDMLKAHFVQFIEGWLNLPDFADFKGRPIFISGESYAGHYIPQVGNALYFRSLQNPDINLRGLAIGNGWMTPKSQVIGRTQFHIDNAAQFKLDAASLKQVVDKGNLCNQEWDAWNPMRVIGNSKVCAGAVPPWTNDPSFNAYDITKPCVGDNCYDLDYLATFFNRPDVLQALGIKDLTWQMCNKNVERALWPDGPTDSMLNAAPLLEAGISILFYTGVNDYVCNWRGTEQVLHDVKWSGQGAWNNIKDYTAGPWGDFKQYKNLKFIKVADSGHMVPHDQAKIAQGLINDFLSQSLN